MIPNVSNTFQVVSCVIQIVIQGAFHNKSGNILGDRIKILDN
jgi:hypothetical protein